MKVIRTNIYVNPYMYQKCDLGLFHKILWIKKGFLTPADELY